MENAGEKDCTLHLSQEYYEDRGYPQFLDHFFAQKRSDLRDFIQSKEFFKEYILKKVHGKDEVIGRAREFKIRNISNFFIENDLRYFQSAKQVLKAGHSQPSQWFRKSGPLEVDFLDNKVYRREKILNELKTLVHDNPISVLEGNAATGKSVLIRTLARDFLQQGTTNIFFLNFNFSPNLNINDLIKEIESLHGLFIFEDVHIDILKLHALLDHFYPNPQQHILFVTRPSWRAACCSRMESLERLPLISLEPLDDLNQMIKHYLLHHLDLPWSPDILKDLRKTSSSNLWLLAYALKGFREGQGKGDSLKRCVGAEVLQDLHDLFVRNPVYPQVLISLSPLYKHEVFTAETYLIHRWGFDLQVLQELVHMGEITVFEEADGQVFYGLPHTALAEIYWEFGKRYRNLIGAMDYSSFVLDYAKFNSGNSLEAVLKATKETCEAVVRELHTTHLLPEIVEKEVKDSTVTDFLFSGLSDSLSNHLLKAVAIRIHRTNEITAIIRWIDSLKRANPKMGKKLLQLVQDDILIAKLNSTPNPANIGFFVTQLWQIDEERAKCLWQSIDHEHLMAKLTDCHNGIETFSFFRRMFETDSDIAEGIWNGLNKSLLAKSLYLSPEVWDIFFSIYEIWKQNQSISQEFCRLLDWNTIAKTLQNTYHLGFLDRMLFDLDNIDDISAKQLCSSLDISFVADLINRTRNLSCIGNFLFTLKRITSQIAASVCQHIDLELLTITINGPERLKDINDCLRNLFDISPNIAGQVCARMNLE
ncbi:MAG TPA: hypothetical protein VHO90_04915, partial [Bacteroidales bacterium]|nr:hypothetical protein [Bacteroidales bacterium]